ncbi:hypothetical protein ACH4E5_41225 [Streptomyces afghaniensis]|uniref:hypothetical protein n=1 Tax=Streptomyces afghaniensis TaxID=66865 RepID=UPI0037B32D06
MHTASERPLPDGAPPQVFQVDDTVVPTLLLGALADDSEEARKALADTLSVLAKAADGKPALPSTDLYNTLVSLFTGSESAYGSAATAVLCGDVAAPQDPETYWHDIQRSRRAHPREWPPGLHSRWVLLQPAAGQLQRAPRSDVESCRDSITPSMTE